MRRYGGRRANGILVACLAVLLPAGVFAATTAGGEAGGQQVRTAGFAQEGIPHACIVVGPGDAGAAGCTAGG